MDNIKKIIFDKNEKFDFENNGNVICIGYFDGLHLIHRKIINAACLISKIENCSFSVFTFEKKIRNNDFEKDNVQSKITKYENLNKIYKPDYIFEMQINDRSKKTSYEDFMKYLKENLNVTKVVIGSDFRFGFEGRGKVRFLKEYFGEDNVIVYSRTQIYSSTLIKELLRKHEYYKIYELNKRFHELWILNKKDFKLFEDEFPFDNGKYEVVIENKLYIMNINNKKVSFDSEVKSKEKYLVVKPISYLGK